MTNSKTTKRALLSSAVALLLCFTMLLGTTFAWFTDSASTGVNTIQSGNLDIVVSYATQKDVVDGAIPDDAWTEVNSESPVFDENALWEPGYTEVVYFKIENAGSLALKYIMSANIASEDPGTNKAGEEFYLSEFLSAYYMTGDTATIFTERENAQTVDGWASMIPSLAPSTLADAVKAELGSAKALSYETSLEAGETAYTTMVIFMPTTVGNEANHNGVDTPSIQLGINFVATQYTSENDSFGNDYDEDAEYPVIPTADKWDGTVDTSWYNDTDTEFALSTAEAVAGLASLVDGGNTFEGKTIKLDADIDLASLPFNPIGHSANGRSFNGTFDGQGHTISNMYEQNDLGAWQYVGEYYGLFAYTNGATIKNVTIADAYISSGRNEAAGVVGNAVDTIFSDITISNTTLIAYNNSAGGVAAECYGECSFTNIVVDEDTVIGPLWGTYDVRLGGVVGMVQSSDKVSFSNITVACQLDAINDVAANYQYWLYRYSGMLIGQVDGVNGVADPTGYVTCENVTVIYGDWVNYHYCEYADLGAGSYNGPGEYKFARVEAGTGTDGIDLSACNHNEDESHNVLIVFDQLFGGGQGVSGLKTYNGVTVVYPNN